jgi:hypothetical protein
MHPEILDDHQKKILKFLEGFKNEFGLVGGTAIALQIGHRQSIDFDLFCLEEFDNFEIQKKINDGIEVEKVLVDKLGEYTFLTQGVKITFLHYPFPIDFNQKFEEYFKMPDLLTLGAMKLYALGRRAKWKDYVDLYFIFKNHCKFKDVLKRAKEIFGNQFNEKIARTQLAYFEDVDFSEEVIYLPGFETNKKEIEKFLIEVSLS